MRLISKIHDFYDGVARTTVNDKTHTFVRESRDITGVKVQTLRIQDLGTRLFEFTIDCEIVGFCGEIYPCLKVTKRPVDFLYDTPAETFYAYTWKDFIEVVPIVEIQKMKSSYRRWYWSDTEIDRIKMWLERGRDRGSWYTKVVYEAVVDPILKNMFRKEMIAYYYVPHKKRATCSDTAVAYPILKDLNFYKVYDAYTCFQKIEHFLTNELIKPDEINIVIPDDMKAQAHGFDKWSFRKMKGD